MSSGPESIWSVRDAARATVAYADIFGFPMTVSEVHRDLIGVEANSVETRDAIADAVSHAELAFHGGYLTLPGRQSLVATRTVRDHVGRLLWPRVRLLARVLDAIPFIRLVGVTGSLAADNPSRDADVDFLLVTEPGRLWLVRAAAIGVGRFVRSAGITLCPNYLLSTRALTLTRQDLYTAHELLQMVPLSGSTTYRSLRDQNSWASRILPNRSAMSRHIPNGPKPVRLVRRIGEGVLAGSRGDRLNNWEAERKTVRLSALGTEGRFSDDVCEGHFGRHRESVMREWKRRCADIGVCTESAPWSRPQTSARHAASGMVQ